MIEVAKAAFPKSLRYIDMWDKLGVCFEDTDFVDLYSETGQSALTPWRLVLPTVMQVAEKLSDRATADAVRGRIEWKYALGLELRDTGFGFSVLLRFRDRLRMHESGEGLFNYLLSILNGMDCLSHAACSERIPDIS